MERIGWLTNDIAEPVQAFDEQVLGKRKAEGLEIAPALANPGVGDGLRRAQSLNRMDIPTLWRAVVRSGHKKDGPVVSIFAPRGTDPAEAGPKLAGLGVVAPGMSAQSGSFDCMFPPETPTLRLIEFAVTALQAIGGLGSGGELQWTVRDKGTLPR